jgi:hypothetical protein
MSIQDQLQTVKDLLASDQLDLAENTMLTLMPKALDFYAQNDLSLGMAEVYYYHTSLVLLYLWFNSCAKD